MYLSLRIWLIIASALLAACTPALQVTTADTYTPQSAALDAEKTERYWWQARFRLEWPEGESPDFAAHLLIAEQVLLPVLIENQPDLPLWRFHRRAGRDGAGNQFSLIFYSDRATADRINEEITTDPITVWLLDNGLLDRVSFEQRSPEELARLELTSDPEWPIEIQRSWPYFIMGVSQTWLMLVQELSQQAQLEGEVDYPALLQHYQSVDSRLNDEWRRYGQHAYLHHLNAVFGYQPLQIRSSQLRTF
tara:strand:- start:2169 stop:2915 length:747 start_codon:yes stop_codon:yes gene_type:complete